VFFVVVFFNFFLLLLLFVGRGSVMGFRFISVLYVILLFWMSSRN